MKVFARQLGKTYVHGQSSEQSLNRAYAMLEQAVAVSWVSSTITEYLLNSINARSVFLWKHVLAEERDRMLRSRCKLFFAKQFYRLGR